MTVGSPGVVTLGSPETQVTLGSGSIPKGLAVAGWQWGYVKSQGWRRPHITMGPEGYR